MSAVSEVAGARPEPVQSALPVTSRPLAAIRSFSATVALKPELSVGTGQPESIYTAQLKTTFQAANPSGGGECEVPLPLPPQIISLADLDVTINGHPSESECEVRWDSKRDRNKMPMT